MPSARLYSSALREGGYGGERLGTAKSLVREIYMSTSPFPTPTTRSFVFLFLLIYVLYFLMGEDPQIFGSWAGQLVIYKTDDEGQAFETIVLNK